MQLIRCYKCGEERGVWWFHGLVTSFKVEKRKVNVSDVWFQVLPLSLSQSWSFESVGCDCLPFISFFSSEKPNLIRQKEKPNLIRQIGFFFVLYHEGHRLAKNLLLIILIFWQISSTFHYALILCAETPFSIWKKVSALISSGTIYQPFRSGRIWHKVNF